MKRTTIYRIRRTDTGKFWSGGAYGHWNENGKSYEKIGAAKCGWSHFKRGSYSAPNFKAEIVEFCVTENEGLTEELK